MYTLELYGEKTGWYRVCRCASKQSFENLKAHYVDNFFASGKFTIRMRKGRNIVVAPFTKLSREFFGLK